MAITSLVMIAWMPACVILFAVMPRVRACAVCFTFGWLMLPMAAIDIKGFLDLDKVLATNGGVMLGAVLFCPGMMRGFRPCAADLILVAFACSTVITSSANDLGVYDGVSTAGRMLLYYGVPYFFGRTLLRTRHDLLEASHIVVAAAALYAILALWEWRMSPQLHMTFYGFFQHDFSQTYRWGSFRPLVFFYSPLALGTFFVWTSLLAVWLYLRKQLRPVLGIPPWAIVAMCLVGLATSMSLGPYLLLCTGLGILIVWQRKRWRHVILLPVLFSFFWMGARYYDSTDGTWLTSLAAEISPARAYSLQYRIDAETMILEKARQHPGFGWGGWGRDRIVDDQGRSVKAVDGLWLVFVSGYGIVGLTLFFLWWCWPLVLNAMLSPRKTIEPAAMALLVAIALQAANFMFNGFLSPVLTLMAGGVVALLLRRAAGSNTIASQVEPYFDPHQSVQYTVQQPSRSFGG